MALTVLCLYHFNLPESALTVTQTHELITMKVTAFPSTSLPLPHHFQYDHSLVIVSCSA